MLFAPEDVFGTAEKKDSVVMFLFDTFGKSSETNPRPKGQFISKGLLDFVVFRQKTNKLF